MNYAKRVLFTSTMLSTLYAADHTTRTELKDFPAEALGQMVDHIGPTQQIGMNATKHHLHDTEIQQTLATDITRSTSQFSAQNLYSALPIDKTDKRSVYNLVHYADILLQLQTLQYAEIIDFLVDLNIDAAIKMKFYGLLEGKYDYTQDFTEAQNMIEEQVAKGNSWAVQMKINGLLEGKYGYTQDLIEAKNIREGQAAKDNACAVQTELDGLACGWYGYTQDFTEAKNLIEQQVAKGNSWAIEKKFNGLLYGGYGYNSNLTEAHSFLNEQIMNNNPWAIKTKFNGLLYGTDGYKKDHQAVLLYFKIRIVLPQPTA